MKNALVGLLSSRKFILLALIAVIGGVFVALGKLPVAEYSAFVAGSATLLMGFIAYEDAASKSAPQTISAGGDVTTNAPVPPREAVTRPEIIDLSVTPVPSTRKEQP